MNYTDSNSYYRYERPHGTFSIGGRMTPAVKALLLANLAVFILQILFDRRPHPLVPGFLTRHFGLVAEDFFNGHVYQIVTYMFLHANAFHILVNMLGLYFLGPETERGMGSRHFLVMYFLSGVLGVGWILLPGGQVCIGASGAVFGVICAFATLYPFREITLLLFFVLPVTMKAWMLGAGYMGIQLLYLLGQEGGNIAYTVHLAGGLVGFIFTAVVFRPELLRRIGWNPRRRVRGTGDGAGGTGEGTPEASAAEIDRLLDKIANQGIASLTRRERALLEQASKNKNPH